jgi:hypothetical protein
MFDPEPMVFISYSRKDRDPVSKLSRRLAARGVRTWVDTDQIVAGEWRTEIKRGLRRANFFIACLSRNTTERGEVLQYEIDSALEIQQERLEGEIFVVPVRLEPCEIPESLRHLQAVDLYEPNGWDNLLRALRSKRRPFQLLKASIPLVLVLAALGAYFGLRPADRSELLDARAEGKEAAVRGRVLLGVTLWKMDKSRESDPVSIREIVHPSPAGNSGPEPAEWTPVRLPSDGVFRRGDCFQAGIESSRTGFLYVFNRSYRSDGSMGPANMIFPTRRIRSGDNRISPGELLRLPDSTSDPPYWQIQSERPDYAGELLIALLSPEPLADLTASGDVTPVADVMLSNRLGPAGNGVKMQTFDSGPLRLTVEEAAARERRAPLTRDAPPPQFLFEGKRGPRAPFSCTLRIPVSEK